MVNSPFKALRKFMYSRLRTGPSQKSIPPTDLCKTPVMASDEAVVDYFPDGAAKPDAEPVKAVAEPPPPDPPKTKRLSPIDEAMLLPVAERKALFAFGFALARQDRLWRAHMVTRQALERAATAAHKTKYKLKLKRDRRRKPKEFD
jgi:hypothetical protein